MPVLRPSDRGQTHRELSLGIESSSIKIPKFQRDFVWSQKQTGALTDSLGEAFVVGVR